MTKMFATHNICLIDYLIQGFVASYPLSGLSQEAELPHRYSGRIHHGLLFWPLTVAREHLLFTFTICTLSE